jgi:hypothetical protein
MKEKVKKIYLSRGNGFVVRLISEIDICLILESLLLCIQCRMQWLKHLNKLAGNIHTAVELVKWGLINFYNLNTIITGNVPLWPLPLEPANYSDGRCNRGEKIGKKLIMLNYLSTATSRHMGEWSYSSTILDLGTRRKWMVKFTLRPLYPQRKRLGINWIRGWVGPRTGLDAMEHKRSLALSGIEHRKTIPWL